MGMGVCVCVVVRVFQGTFVGGWFKRTRKLLQTLGVPRLDTAGLPFPLKGCGRNVNVFKHGRGKSLFLAYQCRSFPYRFEHHSLIIKKVAIPDNILSL